MGMQANKASTYVTLKEFNRSPCTIGLQANCTAIIMCFFDEDEKLYIFQSSLKWEGNGNDVLLRRG